MWKKKSRPALEKCQSLAVLVSCTLNPGRTVAAVRCRALVPFAVQQCFLWYNVERLPPNTVQLLLHCLLADMYISVHVFNVHISIHVYISTSNTVLHGWPLCICVYILLCICICVFVFEAAVQCICPLSSAAAMSRRARSLTRVADPPLWFLFSFI